MASPVWRKKLLYAVYSYVENGGGKKYKQKWVSLGRFERKADGLAAFEDHLLFNSPGVGKTCLFKEIVPKYLEWCRGEKGRVTFLHEESDLDPMLNAFGHLRLDQISPQVIESYRAGKDWARVTVRNRYRLLKMVLNYAERHGFKTSKPFNSIKIPTVRLHELPPKRVDPPIFESIVSGLSGHHLVRGLIQKYTGIRPNEFYRLKESDFNWEGGTLRVEQPKTGGVRFIPLHQKLMGLERSLSSAQEVTPNAFAQALKRSADKIKAQHITPYTFRHQFAFELVRKCKNIRLVQKILGHTDIKMTSRYVDVAEDDMKEAIKLLE